MATRPSYRHVDAVDDTALGFKHAITAAPRDQDPRCTSSVPNCRRLVWREGRQIGRGIALIWAQRHLDFTTQAAHCKAQACAPGAKAPLDQPCAEPPLL